MENKTREEIFMENADNLIRNMSLEYQRYYEQCVYNNNNNITLAHKKIYSIYEIIEKNFKLEESIKDEEEERKRTHNRSRPKKNEKTFKEIEQENHAFSDFLKNDVNLQILIETPKGLQIVSDMLTIIDQSPGGKEKLKEIIENNNIFVDFIKKVMYEFPSKLEIKGIELDNCSRDTLQTDRTEEFPDEVGNEKTEVDNGSGDISLNDKIEFNNKSEVGLKNEKTEVDNEFSDEPETEVDTEPLIDLETEENVVNMFKIISEHYEFKTAKQIINNYLENLQNLYKSVSYGSEAIASMFNGIILSKNGYELINKFLISDKFKKLFHTENGLKIINAIFKGIGNSENIERFSSFFENFLSNSQNLQCLASQDKEGLSIITTIFEGFTCNKKPTFQLIENILRDDKFKKLIDVKNGLKIIASMFENICYTSENEIEFSSFFENFLSNTKNLQYLGNKGEEGLSIIKSIFEIIKRSENCPGILPKMRESMKNCLSTKYENIESFDKSNNEELSEEIKSLKQRIEKYKESDKLLKEITEIAEIVLQRLSSTNEIQKCETEETLTTKKENFILQGESAQGCLDVISQERNGLNLIKLYEYVDSNLENLKSKQQEQLAIKTETLKKLMQRNSINEPQQKQSKPQIIKIDKITEINKIIKIDKIKEINKMTETNGITKIDTNPELSKIESKILEGSKDQVKIFANILNSLDEIDRKQKSNYKNNINYL